MGKGSFFICHLLLSRRFAACRPQQRIAPLDHLQLAERVHISGVLRVLLCTVLRYR